MGFILVFVLGLVLGLVLGTDRGIIGVGVGDNLSSGIILMVGAGEFGGRYKMPFIRIYEPDMVVTKGVVGDIERNFIQKNKFLYAKNIDYLR